MEKIEEEIELKNQIIAELEGKLSAMLNR